MIKRIAVTGPESTGKTRLAKELAKHYKTIWVPEFARDYLNRIERAYTYDDVLYIAQNQFCMNDIAPPHKAKYLFCDTELIVTKIWCDVKYGKCHQWIENHISQQKFDFYLLTDIDLPWEPDPQREHPDQRQYLMELYLHELRHRDLPFRIIKGIEEQRLENAIEFVNDLTDNLARI
ncbi:MAG TPA: ATP-binding protein [Bacteroidales bacterium]|nr:ATP-binding protein [Bacteroidales bacterium]